MICYEEDCPERAEGGFCNEVEFCTKTLAEHDQKVRAEAIDEYTNKLEELMKYGIFVSRNDLLEDISNIAEQLKEKNNE